MFAKNAEPSVNWGVESWLFDRAEHLDASPNPHGSCFVSRCPCVFTFWAQSCIYNKIVYNTLWIVMMSSLSTGWVFLLLNVQAGIQYTQRYTYPERHAPLIYPQRQQYTELPSIHIHAELVSRALKDHIYFLYVFFSVSLCHGLFVPGAWCQEDKNNNDRRSTSGTEQFTRACWKCVSW